MIMMDRLDQEWMEEGSMKEGSMRRCAEKGIIIFILEQWHES